MSRRCATFDINLQKNEVAVRIKKTVPPFATYSYLLGSLQMSSNWADVVSRNGKCSRVIHLLFILVRYKINYLFSPQVVMMIP